MGLTLPVTLRCTYRDRVEPGVHYFRSGGTDEATEFVWKPCQQADSCCAKSTGVHTNFF